MRRKKEKVAAIDPKAEKKQARVDKITRLMAIAFAFVSVFYFFVKLLFL